MIIFSQLVTMVMLMALGVLCYKRNLLDDNANKKLSSLVLMVVNPTVIVMSYHRPFEMELLQGLLIAVGLSVVSHAIGLGLTHAVYRKKGEETFSLEKFGSVYSNSGFIGIPLVNGVFGWEGVFYLTAYMSVFNLLCWTHGVVIMDGRSDIKALKKAFLSPPLVAMYIGLILFAGSITLPGFITHPLELLGATNTPLAMLVAGVSLAKISLFSTLKNARIYKVCIMRLVLIPLAFMFVLNFLNVSPIIAGTIMLVTACPAAANIILFAHRHDKNYEYAAQIFVVTTVLSVVTIPLIMLLL